MPQTEAEHLENQSLDYDDQEKPQSDAEVSNLPYRLRMDVDEMRFIRRRRGGK